MCAQKLEVPGDFASEALADEMRPADQRGHVRVRLGVADLTARSARLDRVNA